MLTDRGLRPALETLVARAPFPVELAVHDERLAADVEAAAYYVVAESLTNIAKYAHASSAQVEVRPPTATCWSSFVSDDGIGGADPEARVRAQRSRRPRRGARGDARSREPAREGYVGTRRDPPLGVRRDINSAIVHDLPTGTVTFLFADVEGSTALQQDPRVDYAAAVTLLRRVLRETVAAHGGAEADAVGDEYVAAFAEPIAGVDAAFATQRALRDAEWPDGATVRVRIGLHVGTP